VTGGLGEPQQAYERALLRYMLTLRTPEQTLVVHQDTFLREMCEDLEPLGPFSTTCRDLEEWAFGDSALAGCQPQYLSCQISQMYRVMVGAFDLGFHPDWLCVPRSPQLGSPRFPAYDRFGRRVV